MDSLCSRSVSRGFDMASASGSGFVSGGSTAPSQVLEQGRGRCGLNQSESCYNGSHYRTSPFIKPQKRAKSKIESQLRLPLGIFNRLDCRPERSHGAPQIAPSPRAWCLRPVTRGPRLRNQGGAARAHRRAGGRAHRGLRHTLHLGRAGAQVRHCLDEGCGHTVTPLGREQGLAHTHGLAKNGIQENSR